MSEQKERQPLDASLAGMTLEIESAISLLVPDVELENALAGIDGGQELTKAGKGEGGKRPGKKRTKKWLEKQARKQKVKTGGKRRRKQGKKRGG